jgi:hypothetical protein
MPSAAMLLPWAAAGPGGGLNPVLVLVIVPVMSGVMVTVVNVVGVITVRDGLVPAAGPMNMIMSVVGGVRQRVLVVMPVMPGVRVAVMNVIGVVPVRHASVAAAGPVLMDVTGMGAMLDAAGHRSSLL